MRKLIVLLLLALIFLCGCQVGEPVRTESETAQTTLPITGLFPTEMPVEETIPPIDGTPIFETVKEQVLSAKNWVLSYSVETVWSLGDASIRDAYTGKATVMNPGKDTMLAVVEEDLAYGTYRESYVSGSCYVRSGSSIFRGNVDGELFLEGLVPAVLMDLRNYAAVEAVEKGNGVTLVFGEALALESWLRAPENAELVSVTASAEVDENGALIQNAYEAVFTVDGKQCRKTVVVEISTPEELKNGDLNPDIFDNCTLLEDIRVPRMLLRTVGAVFSAQSMEAQVSETIRSEVLSYLYEKSSQVTLTEEEDQLSAMVESDLTVSDHRGTVSHTNLKERFRFNVYSSWQGDEEPTYNPRISAQTMRQYCEDIVLSGLLATKYLNNAVLSADSGRLILTLAGNDRFALDMMEHISGILQVDLDAQSGFTRTTVKRAVVVLDEATLLPERMELEFERLHTLNSVTYKSSYVLTEQMQLLAASE